MRQKQWAELDGMWALCAKTWGLWIVCILLGMLTGSIWPPAKWPFIIVGFAAIGYFIVRMVAFSWRWRGDGRHVTSGRPT